MFTNSPEWLARCQTYEGGFAGEPGLEAHGGYSFCGYAALILLGKEHLIDTDRLLKWTVNRQMRLEGGFQGRTNKLVDGCYSFWVSGLLPLLYHRLKKTGII
jgi:protein farnesyltransferase subunit beta